MKLFQTDSDNTTICTLDLISASSLFLVSFMWRHSTEALIRKKWVQVGYRFDKIIYLPVHGILHAIHQNTQERPNTEIQKYKRHQKFRCIDTSRKS